VVTYFIEKCNEVVKKKNCFSVVLSGGKTPEPIYRLLTSKKYKDQIPWKKIHFFFGDERTVDIDHPDSNYRMAKDSLFDKIEIPSENLHQMYTGSKDLYFECQVYESQLDRILPKNDHGVPIFDFIFLGLGEDGHTSSLFPDSTALDEVDRWVAPVYVEKLKSWRITVTFQIINNSSNIVFVVVGKNKANIVKDIFLNGHHGKYPAESVTSKNTIYWFVDRGIGERLF